MISRQLAAPLSREAAKLTITGLETFRFKVNQRGDWVIARLLTSGGVAGLGDASHGGADAETLALLRQYLERCQGRSIFDIAPDLCSYLWTASCLTANCKLKH